MTDLTMDDIEQVERAVEDKLGDSLPQRTRIMKLLAFARDALTREVCERRPENVRYFVDGSDDRQLLTLDQLYRDMDGHWNKAAPDKRPEEIEYLQVYKCLPIFFKCAPIFRHGAADRRIATDCCEQDEADLRSLEEILFCEPEPSQSIEQTDQEDTPS